MASKVQLETNKVKGAVDFLKSGFPANHLVVLECETKENFNELTLTAYDAELTVKCHCRCEQTTKDILETPIVAPLNQLIAFSKHASTQMITVSESEKSHSLTAGKAKFKIPKPAMAPVMPDWEQQQFDGQRFETLDGRNLLQFAKPLAKLLQGSIQLKGVQFKTNSETAQFIATDGMRVLSIRVTDGVGEAEDEFQSVVLPQRALAVMKEFEQEEGPFAINLSDSHYQLELQTEDFSVTVMGSQVVVKYPEGISTLLANKPTNTYAFSLKTLADEAKLHKEISKEDALVIGTFEFEKGQLKISTRDSAAMNSSIDDGEGYTVLNHEPEEGESIAICMALKYLLEGLDTVKILANNTVEMGLTSKGIPLIWIQPTEEARLANEHAEVAALIAPIRA